MTTISDYDPAAPGEAQNPFPGWSRARREAPVFYSPRHNVWWVTKYEDVREVLGDHDTYSSKQALKTPPAPPDIEALLGGMPWEHTITAQDPPDHSRLRKLVQVALTPRHIADREPVIRRIADDLVDRFPASVPFNFVTSFAQQVPLEVITGMVGTPSADTPKLRRWTDAFFQLVGSGESLSAEVRASLYEEIRELIVYCKDFIATRRADPQDDLGTRLIFATTDDGKPRLSDLELCAVILSLLIAGNETSASMITQTLYLLLRSPEQWQAVKARPDLIPAAVEEGLRYTAPVKGIQRVVKRATRLGGVELEAGAQLYLMLGSTGRDEDKWERPDEFDIYRGDLSQHLAFGRGLHFCVGAPLARLEGRVALETIIARVPDIEILDGEDITYSDFLRVLSPARLTVTIPAAPLPATR